MENMMPTIIYSEQHRARRDIRLADLGIPEDAYYIGSAGGRMSVRNRICVQALALDPPRLFRGTDTVVVASIPSFIAAYYACEHAIIRRFPVFKEATFGLFSAWYGDTDTLYRSSQEALCLANLFFLQDKHRRTLYAKLTPVVHNVSTALLAGLSNIQTEGMKGPVGNGGRHRWASCVYAVQVMNNNLQWLYNHLPRELQSGPFMESG